MWLGAAPDDWRKIAISLITMESTFRHNECFYEKVIKVKADVAAVLNIFQAHKYQKLWLTPSTVAVLLSAL
jgi:hypothetical protein